MRSVCELSSFNCAGPLINTLNIHSCLTLDIQCFSYGCEAGRHLRGHNYELRDPLGGRTFDSKGSWGATEECKLLAAAYRFKLGNWYAVLCTTIPYRCFQHILSCFQHILSGVK